MLYFDNAATTSIDEEVLNTYINALKKYYNNPSATHRFGMEGNNLLLSAKRQIAKYLSFTGCKEDEIILTSGATESNNLAIKGYVERYKKRGKHLITTKVEHPSVLNVYKNFEQSGYDVTYLDVTPSGIDENALKKERFTINELEERLRTNNIFNIGDVEYAVLETSGQVTVIPKPNKRATTPEDFNIEPKYEGIPYDLVVDGKVMYKNLEKLGKNYVWLQKQTEKLQAEADTNIEITKAKADAEKTRIASESQAKANKELSASITDKLIRMKEAEAHYKNGWVTVQGAGNTVVDATEK